MSDTQKHKKPNVPNLRFPEFSGEWEKTTIGKIADVLCGYAFKGKDILEEGKNLLMRGINISEGNIRHSIDIDRFYSGPLLKLIKYQIRTGDIVTSMDGSKVGRNTAYVSDKEENALLVQRVCRIRGDVLDLGFIYQQLNSQRYYAYVDSVKTASAIPHISQNNICSFPIVLPKNNSEKKKIIGLFNAIDKRIEIQNKVIEDLIKAKSTINDEFHKTNTHGIKTCFADLGVSYSGLSGKSAMDFGQGCQFIPYTNVFANTFINEEDMGFVRIAEGERQNKVENGDLILTLSSETPEEVGVGSVYLGHERDLYLNSFCFGIHILKRDIVIPEYLAYLVESRVFRKFVYPLAQGSTRYNLQKGDFEKMEIIIPQIEKQQELITVLNSISNKQKLEKEILEGLTIAKQSLLQRLFV